MAVAVERERHRAMPHVDADRLQVQPGSDEEARGRMPGFVKADPVQPRAFPRPHRAAVHRVAVKGGFSIPSEHKPFSSIDQQSVFRKQVAEPPNDWNLPKARTALRIDPPL